MDLEANLNNLEVPATYEQDSLFFLGFVQLWHYLGLQPSGKYQGA